MSRQFWPEWAQKLQHSPLKGILLTFLQGSGPFKLLVGQLMLAGSVFIDPTSSERWLAVAEMLEDEEQSKAFSALLTEEKLP
jgi:hypothetical protein